MKYRILQRIIFLGVLVGVANLVIGANLSDQESARYRSYELSKKLRCLNCSNQSLADSEIASARAIKQRIFIMVLDGASDQEIVSYLVRRYGTEINYEPPLDLSTIILWLLPFFGLICGAIILIFKNININLNKFNK